jgi:protocatechuate 3,4-dioxygenase beta subunit
MKQIIIKLILLLSLQSDCTWCGTREAPKDVTWETEIITADEKSEKIIISGIVFKEDGITPQSDVIIYIHHTNSSGIYPKRGNETGNGKYHGYLRGWMKTDSLGRYRFITRRPAPYQTHGGEPAHIHYNYQAPGYPEVWITGLWFADDPRVTDQLRKNVKRPAGKTNIVTLSRNKYGILEGQRDIVIKKYNVRIP